MTITREKPCADITRTHKLRRDDGYQNRFYGVTGLEDKYRNTRRVRHAKSVRSAATEFLNPKKEWSIFISCPAINPDLERDFHKLAEQWHVETRFHSSLSKKFMHPAYQTIMAMGDKALPLILTELQKAPTLVLRASFYCQEGYCRAR